MEKYSFLDKKIVYQTFYCAPLMFSFFLQGKFLCFGMRRQVDCEVFIVWRSSLKKWYLRFYLTKIVHSNDKMLFFQPKDCLWRAALVKLFFLQGKVCVLYPCVGKSLARCLSFEAFWRPCRKNDISAYIWQTPFIQMVKCSSFNQRIVYQNFYGALLMLSYFFFKFCVLKPCESLARCLLFEAFRPCQGNDISGIWHKPFFQIGKYSVPWQKKQ